MVRLFNNIRIKYLNMRYTYKFLSTLGFGVRDFCGCYIRIVLLWSYKYQVIVSFYLIRPHFIMYSIMPLIILFTKNKLQVFVCCDKITCCTRICLFSCFVKKKLCFSLVITQKRRKEEKTKEVKNFPLVVKVFLF